jgi:hypothetical protein
MKVELSISIASQCSGKDPHPLHCNSNGWTPWPGYALVWESIVAMMVISLIILVLMWKRTWQICGRCLYIYIIIILIQENKIIASMVGNK